MIPAISFPFLAQSVRSALSNQWRIMPQPRDRIRSPRLGPPPASSGEMGYLPVNETLFTSYSTSFCCAFSFHQFRIVYKPLLPKSMTASFLLSAVAHHASDSDPHRLWRLRPSPPLPSNARVRPVDEALLQRAARVGEAHPHDRRAVAADVLLLCDDALVGLHPGLLRAVRGAQSECASGLPLLFFYFSKVLSIRIALARSLLS
jgi:hypothetical protein